MVEVAVGSRVCGLPGHELARWSSDELDENDWVSCSLGTLDRVREEGSHVVVS